MLLRGFFGKKIAENARVILRSNGGEGELLSPPFCYLAVIPTLLR